jgi:MOSC domain-containing protein YiiM
MEIKDLMSKFAGDGHVHMIMVRPKRLEPVQILPIVFAQEGLGLIGDRYNSREGNRQVTLIQYEHVQAIEKYLMRYVDPSLLRRNIVTQGINLLALKGKSFYLGDAILQYSGECHPCSRMEQNLGTGGYNAMRGHGGITAKIIKSGNITLGDALRPI